MSIHFPNAEPSSNGDSAFRWSYTSVLLEDEHDPMQGVVKEGGYGTQSTGIRLAIPRASEGDDVYGTAVDVFVFRGTLV